MQGRLVMNDNNDRFDDVDTDLNFIKSFYSDLNNNTDNKYFTFEAINHLQKSNDEFSILFFNIRSLSFNYDKCHVLIAELNYSFDSLCISEG